MKTVQPRSLHASLARVFGLVVLLVTHFLPSAFAADGFASAATGGAGGTAVTVTTAAELLAYAANSSDTPYVITVSGVITITGGGGNSGGTCLVRSNKTVQGADANATIIGTLEIPSDASNVVIKNLNLTNPRGIGGGDGVTIMGGKNVHITQCTFWDCSDGMLDTRNGADLITISWCKFFYTRDKGHNFVSLIAAGEADVGPYRMTFHHNWWSVGCQQRMPAQRYGSVHLYNNYWNAPGNGYCSNARDTAQMLAENNHYDSVNDPISKSTGTSALISTEGNLYTHCTGTIDPGTDTVFAPPYAYTLDPAADVRSLVMAGAGNGVPAPLAAAPSHVVASAGNKQVALTWTASSGAITYQVRRSTTSGGPYSLIAEGVTSSGYTDTGLANDTVYYYAVSAVNASGASAPSEEVWAFPTDTVYAVDCGSAMASGEFDADEFYSGGSAGSTAAAIDTSALLWPAPPAVYQSDRRGDFTYAFEGLAAGTNYLVRIHFAELVWSAAGDRVFNVAINGAEALSNFDVLAASGAKYRPVIREFTRSADASGRIVVQFGSVVDEASCAGIEVLDAPTSAPAVPADLAAVAADEFVALSWTAGIEVSSYTVKRATVSGGPYATVATGVASTRYVDGGLSNGTRYYYVITAANAVGESAASPEVGSTPTSSSVPAPGPQSVFVSMVNSQVPAGSTPTAAETFTIAPPGPGWEYSAAAPVVGTTWNRIQQPNPRISSNVTTGSLGTFACNSADNITLFDSSGASSGIRLTVAVNINFLEGGTSTRTEPNTASGGSTLLGPSGLMGDAWRIYRGENSTTWTLAGLVPGAHYYLYLYGATRAAGQGCRFTLASENIAEATSSLSTTGGSLTGTVEANGSIFTTDGSTYSLVAPGAQWARLHAVADASGQIIVDTGTSNRNQYYNGFQLTPYPAPVITLQPPANLSATFGSTLNIQVAATGDGALSYRWRKSTDGGATFANLDVGANPSAASAVLSLSNVQASDQGVYQVVVSNAGGSIASQETTVTVSNEVLPPSIEQHPQSVTVLVGQAATFAVVANGTSPLTYRWEKSSDGITYTTVGADSSSLVISAAALEDAGFYRVVVNNETNEPVTSTAATLTVNQAPVVTASPQPTVQASGSTYTLAVVASGSPAPSYQWYRNGAAIAGATSATLELELADANSGYYAVTVSNAVSSVATTPVYVGVPTTTTFTAAPAADTTGVNPDSPLILSFSTPFKLGTSGAVRIHDAATGAVVTSIDLATLTTETINNVPVFGYGEKTSQGTTYKYQPIAIYGNEVWIRPASSTTLSYGKTYYVTADPAFLIEAADNTAFPGFKGAEAWRFSTKASAPSGPSFTVAADGSGDFTTIQGACDAVPSPNSTPHTIRIAPGVYRERVILGQNRNFVTLEGTGEDRSDVLLIDGWSNSKGTLTVGVSDVRARNFTVENSAGQVGPQNALYADRPRQVFENMVFKGWQDTLASWNGQVAYFYKCDVWGSVDFIYSGGTAVFDRCDITQIRDTGGPAAAPSTPSEVPHGSVFLNCHIVRGRKATGHPMDVAANSSTLMRPWREFGATAYINCVMDDHITLKGWSEWDGREATCRAFEYGTTLTAGGTVTAAQRRAAGAYWVQDADPANYTLEAIFGAVGSWRPSIAPVIEEQPASVTVTSGQSATFSVAAVGLPTPTYQWFRDGNPLEGAIGPVLTLDTARVADAGEYTVVVTNSAGSVTSAPATLAVNPAAATIELGDLSHVYTGEAKVATTTTVPAGLAVEITYDGGSAAPVNAGSYAVKAIVVDPNYTAEPAIGTLVIAKASAGIAFDTLVQAYDGTPKPVAYATAPSGLVVNLTYGGSSTAPIYPGTYAVIASVDDPNYAAVEEATLRITITALVRHRPTLDGILDGSVQVLAAEEIVVNGTGVLSGDLLVPGTPALRINGQPTYAGVKEATGSASPSTHTITLNGGAVMRYLVKRVDPIAMAVVPAPSQPTGTRSVTLTKAGQSAGDFATLRNLTLSGSAGAVAVQPGTYGTFSAAGGTRFVLGEAGALEPAQYEFQSLTLNGDSSIQVLGPVTVTLASGLVLSGSVGNAAHPEWLLLRAAAQGVTLNEGATVHGEIVAPGGAVIVGREAAIHGRVTSDTLTLNDDGLLEEVEP